MDATARSAMVRQATGDFLRLAVRAFVGGTGVAVAMALAILALSASSYAAPVNGAPEPRSAAPAPSPGADSPGAGALWARDDAQGEMHLLLGLLGLGATAIVAVVGRRN